MKKPLAILLLRQREVDRVINRKRRKRKVKTTD
jgi:hypothetical protein